MGGSCAVPNNWNHRGNVVARRRQARKPKCRIRTKPCGSRCSRKRRKNLSCDKLVSFCSLWSAESRQRKVTLAIHQSSSVRFQVLSGL